MQFLKTLVARIGDRINPVAPFIQDFADFLRDRPLDVLAVTNAARRVVAVTPLVGELADNGLQVVIGATETAGVGNLTVESSYFDDIGVTKKEAKILMDAVDHWLALERMATIPLPGGFALRRFA